jgi:radical SAM protein with 4Fe4S-binding SPASM domain
LINTKTIPVDSKNRLLLFNPELATWCFLEDRERVLYDYLKEGVEYSTLQSVSFIKENGLGGGERLNSMLTHLYDQGMLQINRQEYINQELYRKGPLFIDIPMLELWLTQKCNLKCSYCFANSGLLNKDMNYETAAKAIDQMLELPGSNIYIKFSGGEPLIKTDLMEKICDYTIEKMVKIKTDGYLLFEVTTNGTLIDKKTADLFKKYNMRILVSLDGPEKIHNRHRKYTNGKPTFEDVMAGINQIQEMSYPFRVITVVSQTNIDHLSEIFEFFTKNNIKNVRFNPILKHGRGKEDWNNQGIEPDEYLSFMKKLFTLSMEYDSIQDDNIESMLRNLVFRTRNYKCMRSTCGCGNDYFCITPEGNIFPCAYFLSETQSLKLGNINNETRLSRCGNNHPVVNRFSSRIVDKIDECRQCDWRHLCEGGCTLGAYMQSNKILTPTYLCSYFKKIYPFLLSRLASKPNLINQFLAHEACLEKI